MHIGIVGPIHIPSLKDNITTDTSNWINGMGGTPVNHQINALLNSGHRVSVFSLSPEIELENSFEWHQENLSIYVGPYRKRASHRCIDLFRRERQYLKNAIKKAMPQIIHAHWQYEWAWAALDSKIPTLVTCHDSPIKILKVQKDIYRLVRLMMAIIVLNKAKYLSAVSPYTANGLKYITGKPITIVPNFEPDDVFQYYRKGKANDKAKKIAMVNNGFYGLKNVGSGIKAFVAFQKQNPDAELHLYGYGHGINEDAYKWCKKMGYEKGIFFKGAMPFSELIKDLSKTDILLHTSYEESCPMVVIEAFALGLPVIGGEKSGGIPWMVEKGCGFLVNVESTQSIVDALLYLSQPEVYWKYSENARQAAVRRFSEKTVIGRYQYLYNKILESQTLSNKLSKATSPIV